MCLVDSLAQYPLWQNRSFNGWKYDTWRIMGGVTKNQWEFELI